MNVVISAILMIAFVVVPTAMVAHNQALYTPVVEVLFNILLTGASVWFGISLTGNSARSEAAKRWLPAAETACKQLLTISSTAERMRRTQASACKAIEPMLPAPATGACHPIKLLVELQCRETAEKLGTLRDHIDNAVSHWEVFIGNNCEDRECEAIFCRIDDLKQKLRERIDETGVQSDCQKTARQDLVVTPQAPLPNSLP